MTMHEWNSTYTTFYKDESGNIKSFFPLHNKTEGAMETIFTNGIKIGGTYNAKEENGNFYLGTEGEYGLFELTEEGFSITDRETSKKKYFTRFML